MPEEKKPIPPEAYDLAYFLQECEGHEEYLATGGKELPRRLRMALAFAGELAGRRVLDLGCGRGELLRRCAEEGALAVGVDYSADALHLAAQILPPRAGLLRGNVRALPFMENSFELVFALDLVEHLYPEELAEMFAEVRRILAPGGKLIIHTMPNLWYYRYGYPFFRLFQRLRGVSLPRDPRDRWRRVHVNEQTLLSLRRSLEKAGLKARVYLRNTQDFRREGNPFLRWVYRFLATVYPFAWIFCNDLFAVAIKEE